MQPYAQFLIPLLFGKPQKGCHVKSPLDEEMWLMENTSGEVDWKSLARKARKVYGFAFLHKAQHLDPRDCQIPEWSNSSGFRFFLKDGKPTCFVMEHPSLVTIHDAYGDPDTLPQLARPSLFAHCYGVIQNQPGRKQTRPEIPRSSEANVQAFYSEIESILDLKPTDWHLEPARDAYHLRLRHNGSLSDPSRLSNRKGQWLVNSLVAACKMGEITDKRPSDGSCVIKSNKHGSVHLRMSLIPALHGLAMAVRFIYLNEEASNGLECLGFSGRVAADLVAKFNSIDGLWLVCGPTGSGKSTTQHTFLELAVTQNQKVLTVEDPVERIIEGVQQVQVNADSGMTFSTTLKAFMRQSPDTILLGEIRDQETAKTALLAAFSGHRILATLHAGNTSAIIRRFEDLQQEKQWVESAISIIIHQRLLPLLCMHCRQPARIGRTEQQALRKHLALTPDKMFFATGCSRCIRGIAGRTGLFSVEEITHDTNPGIQFQKQAISHLMEGRTDLENALTFLPESLRMHFDFHKCKDFAN